MANDMHTGTVTKFNSETGWGFIRDDDNNIDDNVFVHQSDIDMDGFRSLNPGDRVEYDLEQNTKGWKASNVTVTDSSSGNRNRSYDRRDDRRSYDRRSGYDDRRGGYDDRRSSGNDHALQKRFNILQARFTRLLEVLAISNDDVDAVINEEDIDYIKSGEKKEAVAS